MTNVRVITDATAYLRSGLVAEQQITVLPVDIQFGEDRYLLTGGRNLKALFKVMADGTAKPTRAIVQEEAFLRAYDTLNRETEEILVIVGSGKLSNAYSVAQKAARNFMGRCRIDIMDSLTTSWGLGRLVESAAESASTGHSLDEIVRLVRSMVPHIYLVCFVQRLDYLEQGRRVGIAQALLGTMLRIKPILLIEGGEIITMEKVRTEILALEKLSEFVGEFASVQDVVLLRSPLDGGTDEMIAELMSQLREVLPGQRFPVIHYDPVLACHVGPDAIGVIVYEGV
jgi:DegV family protein with EDD domain